MVIFPVFDIHHAEVTQHESPSDQFRNIQRDDDAMRWIGRGSIMELPEDGTHGSKYGAGGNADASGDPIDTLHDAAKRSFHVCGPASGIGKGNKVERKGRK